MVERCDPGVRPGVNVARQAQHTGLCENVEYVVTPAVIVTFITAYLNSIFGFDPAYSPVI